MVGSAFFEDFNQFAEVGFGFGDQDIFATGRNACVEGNVTGIPTHNFDEEQTVVGIGGIPDFVNAFHHGIGGGIKTDGLISTVQVVINGAW